MSIEEQGAMFSLSSFITSFLPSARADEPQSENDGDDDSKADRDAGSKDAGSKGSDDAGKDEDGETEAGGEGEEEEEESGGAGGDDEDEEEEPEDVRLSRHRRERTCTENAADYLATLLIQLPVI